MQFPIDPAQCVKVEFHLVDGSAITWVPEPRKVRNLPTKEQIATIKRLAKIDNAAGRKSCQLLHWLHSQVRSL